jgi:serine/threonine protein kinase
MLREEGYNTKADIFSVGSILFNLLTGEPLFNGSNAKEIFQRNKICELTPVKHLIDNLPLLAKDLILKLLSPDPDTRPSASEALQHVWFSQDKEALVTSLLANRELAKLSKLLIIDYNLSNKSY